MTVLPEVSGFAGKLGEAILGGAVMGVVSQFTELFGEMVAKSVEGAAEIVKGVIEIGEQFDELNKQVVDFTNAEGVQLEQLKTDVTDVFSRIDVGSKNLGENLDVFHQRLGLIGPDLQKLTYDFTELSSRLGSLDVRSFSANLDAFGISGDKADAALRTLAGDAQQYGDTLTELNATMATAEPTFTLLGISYNAAAEASAKLNAMGPNAMKVMNGLAMSGKEFAKLPNGTEDFKKFIDDTIQAIDYYKDHGETSKAESLAATMFGSRQWPIVLRSLDAIKDAMAGVGDQGNEINVDKFVEDTALLENKWEQFKHMMETDFKPVGIAAIQSIIGGLNTVSDWVSDHQNDIRTKLQGWGDAFINQLPNIQHFTGEAIRLTGLFFEFIKDGSIAALDTFSELIQAWGTLTGDDKLVAKGQGFMDMANTLNKVDFGKASDAIANLVETKFDPEKIREEYDKAMGKAFADAKTPGGGIGATLDVTLNPKAPDGSTVDDAHPLQIPKAAIAHGGGSGTSESGSNAGVNAWNSIGNSLWENDPFIRPDKILNPNWYMDKYSGAVDQWTKPGDASAGQAAPGIVHSGDPGDPVHVALADYSQPLPPQAGPGGYGKGGGGPSHNANQGYGSVGSDGDGNTYDAPTDPRNQLPGKKSQSADPGDLIGPLFDALGFGNVLGGPNPENLGIVKLMKGLISWMNTPPGGAGPSGGSTGSPTADALGLGRVNTGPKTLLDSVLGKLIPGYGGGDGGAPDAGGGGASLPTIPGWGSSPSFTPGSGDSSKPWMQLPPPKPATSYDKGGTLLPGDTSVTNATGMPETVVPNGASWLDDKHLSQLQQQVGKELAKKGLSDDQIRASLAINATEGGASNPMSILGFVQGQSNIGPVPATDIPSRVTDYMTQFTGNAPGSRLPGGGIPGFDAQGKFIDPPGVPPGTTAMTWMRQNIVGQRRGEPGGPNPSGGGADWQGNMQPLYTKYQGDLMNALNGLPGGPPATIPKGMPGAGGPSGSLIGGGASGENAYRDWFNGNMANSANPGGANPLSHKPGFNPLTDIFGGDSKFEVSGIDASAAMPNNPYAGLGADTGATATPGAISKTSNPQFGGIPNAPSGAGQNIDAFMTNVMNQYNQEHGTHLKVTADYPGGPTGHPDDGADHSVRRALDISSNDPREMNDFAAYWYNNPALRAATRQLIHDPEWDKGKNNPFTGDMNIIGGHSTPGAQTYAGAPYAPGPKGPGHADHDHIAMQYIPPGMGTPTGNLVSAAPNTAPGSGQPSMFGSSDPSGGMHFDGHYMPMFVTPSAIDPKPAVTAMQHQQNAQAASAGSLPLFGPHA